MLNQNNYISVSHWGMFQTEEPKKEKVLLVKYKPAPQIIWKTSIDIKI